MVADRNPDAGHSSEYEMALEKALSDLSDARRNQAITKERAEQADVRVAELSILVRNLLGILQPEQRQKYEVSARDLGAGEQQPVKVGPVYDNIVSLFSSHSNKKQWTANEVQAALASRNESIAPKSVYNVLNYMEKRGRLRRISRGRYLIVDLGIGIDLGYDLLGVDAIGRHAMDE